MPILITRTRLVRDLKSIGVCEGDTVAVTLSVKSIGSIEGGADAFLDALIEAVGIQGTIMMNAYTNSFPASEIPAEYVFDPATTMPYTGIAPKILLKRKGAIRSTHPTCSVVAYGKNARYLTENHTVKTRPYLPYTLLAEIGGKYLAIGTGNNLVAIRHEAQHYAGIPRFLHHGVLYKTAQGEKGLFIWDLPACEKNLATHVPRLDRMGFMHRGKIGQADAVIMQADDFLQNEAALLRSNPALNQCSDILCLQCRELERRMNLHGTRFFQRSYLMRKTLQLRNYLVIIKRHNRVLIRKTNPKEMDYYLDFAFRVAAKRLTKLLL